MTVTVRRSSAGENHRTSRAKRRGGAAVIRET
jgi:hypothetical protein